MVSSLFVLGHFLTRLLFGVRNRVCPVNARVKVDWWCRKLESWKWWVRYKISIAMFLIKQCNKFLPYICDRWFLVPFFLLCFAVFHCLFFSDIVLSHTFLIFFPKLKHNHCIIYCINYQFVHSLFSLLCATCYILSLQRKCF